MHLSPVTIHYGRSCLGVRHAKVLCYHISCVGGSGCGSELVIEALTYDTEQCKLVSVNSQEYLANCALYLLSCHSRVFQPLQNV
jgi:hypothetical protein